MNRSSFNSEIYLEGNDRPASSDYGMIAAPNGKLLTMNSRKTMPAPQFATQKFDGIKCPQFTLVSSDTNGQAKFASDEVNNYFIIPMFMSNVMMMSLTPRNVVHPHCYEKRNYRFTSMERLSREEEQMHV